MAAGYGRKTTRSVTITYLSEHPSNHLIILFSHIIVKSLSVWRQVISTIDYNEVVTFLLCTYWILFFSSKLSPKYIVALLYFTWLSIIASDVWLTCKGICERHKALKPSLSFGGARYSAGQKRCAICALFITWDGLWCPCCGCRLRTNPRSTQDRRRVKRKKAVIYLHNL
jgi:hypothetical protein